MATAPIQYKSELEPLLTQLMGTREKTSGSTSTTSTTSTANTDPLQQIFQSQAASSTPAGMENLIQEVFRIGAQKTPELTEAMANARGARSTGNSPLALALGELQKNLAGQAAQLVGKQQESAAQTAGAIATATAGKNTTATTGGSTITRGAGGGANPLMAAGVLTNIADKTGLLAKLKSQLGLGTSAPVLDANAATAGYDSYDYGGALNQPGAAPAPAAPDVATSFAPADLGLGSTTSLQDFGLSAPTSPAGVEVGGAIDSGNAVTGVDLPAIDAGNAASAASAATDTYDAYDYGSSASDASDFFKEFLADGGLVNVADMRSKQAARKYADGGPVEQAAPNRGRSNMGAPATSPQSGALNYQEPDYGIASTNQQQIQQQAQQQVATPADQLKSQLSSSARNAGSSSNGPDMGDQLLGSAINYFGGPIGWGVNKLLGGSSVEGNIIGQVAPGVVQGAGEIGDTVEEAGLGVGQALGDTAANVFVPVGDAVDNAIGGVVESAGNFFSSIFDDFADGGAVKGAGTGVSDSIPAMLSDGEFVMSKDVVDAVGADFLQSLQDKYHTPAATQKRTGVK